MILEEFTKLPKLEQYKAILFIAEENSMLMKHKSFRDLVSFCRERIKVLEPGWIEDEIRIRRDPTWKES